MKQYSWCCIGDSYTYLNDHPAETGNRVKKGYISRTAERLGNVKYKNIGINGSQTGTWLTQKLPRAEIYSVLLGINDVLAGVPVGQESDLLEARTGTMLGNIGDLIRRIRLIAPYAPIVLMTPVQHTDFVYILDATNNSHFRDAENAVVEQYADRLLAAGAKAGCHMVDLYHRCGFSAATAMRYKRFVHADITRDVPYPAYLKEDWAAADLYPYPPEAANMMYDGLHPSDKGNAAIADQLCIVMEQAIKQAARVRHAKKLLADMTPEEKAGQLTQCGNSIYNEDYKVGWDWLRAGEIGSFLGICDVKQANELQHVAVNETRLGIPLLFGLDVIHGYRTIFPVPMAQGCSWNPELAGRAAHIAAAQARRGGANWVYSPMIDIARDARWGRGVEGYGEDPCLTSCFAEQTVRGLQGTSLDDTESVAACAKHFLAYGACEGGRDYNSVDLSEQTLYNTYLPPFRAAVRAGVAGVMTAFHDLNGEPCTGSRRWITEVLRKELGFSGVTISDAGSLGQIQTHGYTQNAADTAATALAAGLDVEMCFGEFCYHDQLPALCKENRLRPGALDEAVFRVLMLKERLGLFDHPYFAEDAENEPASSGRDLARELARQAVVLLKNEKDTLPFTAEKKVLITGPMADDGAEMLGTWSCLGRPEETVTPWQAFRAEMPQTAVFAPCTFHRENTGRGEAVLAAEQAAIEHAAKAAADCDAVIAFIGEPAGMTGEGKSRTQNLLPSADLALLRALHKTGKPVIAVVTAGRPLVLTQAEELSNALLFAGALGSEAGNAYADLLLGKVSPSGRLVQTMPTVAGQAPLYYAHHNTGKPPVEEFFWTSKYADAPILPLHPFGFGLSYTAFRYDSLTLSADHAAPGGSITARITVSNTGTRTGTETVQCYFRDAVASEVQPVARLVGFCRAEIPAGESRTVEFTLNTADFGFWNRALEYCVEPGEIEIMAGPNAQTLPLQSVLTVCAE